ncbi:hypothetical protein [Mesorhizobium sp. B2-5-11]|uniref:hypothetical protein n=1 Tax=Mesorhizobium sp. B2-5-11 TaxID=2589919 RepID=UPI00112914E3|nr:hypothetical protein [Mesorhizobium sp. B2-5-11]TPK14116.1 hypothetical protein FJ490_01995 [Mesorhizobium sp. B2-5-11]
MSAKTDFTSWTWSRLTPPQKAVLLSMPKAGSAIIVGRRVASADALKRLGLIERIGYAQNGLQSIFVLTDVGREIASFGSKVRP